MKKSSAISNFYLRLTPSYIVIRQIVTLTFLIAERISWRISIETLLTITNDEAGVATPDPKAIRVAYRFGM